MNNKHIQWIDALKGFGIFCVTLGHLSPWYPLEKHIYSFHMFLFFFISGYLFKSDCSLSAFIKKKFKGILIPFIIWNFLASGFAFVSGEKLGETISKFFIINGELCWNSPIWFLLILFITESLYAIIIKIKLFEKYIIILPIISTILWILIGTYSYPLKLNLLPLAILFYSLGNIFHTLCNNEHSSKFIIITVILSVITSILFGTILNTRISYTGGTFGNIYYCIIAALSGTLFYVLVFKKWNKLGENKILCKLGKNSLIIMTTQYWFFRLYDIISYKLFDISIWHFRNTLKAILISTFTICLIIISVNIFKKIFKNNKKVLLFAKYMGIR